MRLALIVLLALGTVAVPAAQKDQKGAEGKQQQSTTTLTGVIDQKGSEFVLSGEQAMKTTAVLRAKGFTDDNFARFVGNRVQVRGELTTEGDRQILTVRSLADLKSLGPSGSPK
jgi:hypothetical protein